MFQIAVVALLALILWRSIVMSQALARLQSEVADQTTVIDSAVSLLEGLSAQIRELSEDPAALNELADKLDANSARLAAAVATNTPAADGEEIPAGDLDPIPSEDDGA